METGLERLSWKQCTGLEEETIKWLENCTQAGRGLKDPVIYLIAVNEHCILRSVLDLILFDIIIAAQVGYRMQLCRWF